MNDVLTVVHWTSGILLTVAALLAVGRMIVGPTVLNRALANDVLVSIIVCVLGLEAVVARHQTTLPILITLSLLGFAGTVAIARFVARDVDESFDEQPHHPLPPHVDHHAALDAADEPVGTDDRPDHGGAR